MKKILFLNHNQEKFGTYFRCFWLGKNLSEIGNKIIMICASGRKFDLLIRKQKINKNFTIITLPRVRYGKFFTGQIEIRLPLAILFVLFLRYDICHAFTVAQPQIGIPAWVAKKIRRKRLIVDWDDLWGGGFAEFHSWPIRKVLTWFETKIPKIADQITYVSEFLGQKIEKLGLKDIAYKIPNGSDPEKIKPLDKNEARQKLNLPVDKKYLVAMGNTYLKSFQVLLEAIALVIKEHPKATLILLGRIEIPTHLENLYNPIKENIIIAGFKPMEEVAWYLAAADALVLPMDDDPIEKARFPIRLGDYTSAGRPIISNAVGEVKYFLEKYQCGLTSDPLSSEQLAANIIKVISDHELASGISANARRVAEEILPWSKIVRDLHERVYARLNRNKKLGIIILSPFYEPNTGGVETHLRDLTKYLRGHGHKVCVLTYKPLTTVAKAALFEKDGKDFVVHRVPWIGHNLFHKLEKHPIFQFLYLTPILFIYTFFFLLKNHNKYEVIHAHGLTAALISRLVCSWFGLRYVVSMHAIYGFKNGWWLTDACHWLLCPAKKIFCLAEASKYDIMGLGLEEKKLDIYIQWVDQDNFKPRDRSECRKNINLEEKFTVLFLGRLIEKKGILVILEAAKQLIGKVNFVFVGDGPMYETIKKAEKELGNIIAVGKKDQEEAAIYYGACDLVVLPAQYEEGFARNVLETISSGRSIIASNKGCLPEMITKDVGVLIEPLAENLTKQIEYFYNNIDALLVLEKNCRAYGLEHFSEKHARPIEDSYYEL